MKFLHLLLAASGAAALGSHGLPERAVAAPAPAPEAEEQGHQLGRRDWLKRYYEHGAEVRMAGRDMVVRWYRMWDLGDNFYSAVPKGEWNPKIHKPLPDMGIDLNKFVQNAVDTINGHIRSWGRLVMRDTSPNPSLSPLVGRMMRSTGSRHNSDLDQNTAYTNVPLHDLEEGGTNRFQQAADEEAGVHASGSGYAPKGRKGTKGMGTAIDNGFRWTKKNAKKLVPVGVFMLGAAGGFKQKLDAVDWYKVSTHPMLAGFVGGTGGNFVGVGAQNWAVTAAYSGNKAPPVDSLDFYGELLKKACITNPFASEFVLDEIYPDQSVGKFYVTAAPGESLGTSQICYPYALTVQDPPPTSKAIMPKPLADPEEERQRRKKIMQAGKTEKKFVA